MHLGLTNDLSDDGLADELRLLVVGVGARNILKEASFRKPLERSLGFTKSQLVSNGLVFVAVDVRLGVAVPVLYLL